MIRGVRGEYGGESLNRGDWRFKFMGSNSQELITLAISGSNGRKASIQRITQNRDFIVSRIDDLLVHTKISEPMHFADEPANSWRDRAADKQLYTPV
jgi:hypothetical protein